MAFALCLVALIVSMIRLVQTRGEDLVAWGLAALAVSLTWGRF